MRLASIFQSLGHLEALCACLTHLCQRLTAQDSLCSLVPSLPVIVGCALLKAADT